MANDLETPNIGNFSIQDTMEMGMGSTELLNDLLGPDTASANPDDIKDIKSEETQATKATKASTKVDEEEDTSRSITDFLLGGDEEEEEEEEVAPIAKAKEAPEAATSEEEDDDAINPFAAFSRDLFKLGGFTKDEDEGDVNINTAEEFLERFESEKKKGASEIVETFIGRFGEDYQNAFTAIFVNGVDPKEYFGTYNAIQSFSDLDLSDDSEY